MPAIEIRPAPPTVPAGLLRAAERDEREVRAGAWSLRLSDGRLDDLRYGAARILRGVRFVVRDRDWSTFETTRVEFARSDGELVVEGECSDGAARVEWTLRVGVEEAVLSIALEARAVTTFLRNRLGLIVLHGPELAGAALDARRPDGGVDHTAFPERISPHQPAWDIARLSWSADGVPVEVAFEGEVFEMEDQRNWTDASFKTYSTPLGLPFPVEVVAGEVIRQSLRIECSGPAPAETRARPATLARVTTGGAQHRLPEIRTSASSAPTGMRLQSGTSLGLLVECDPRWAGWRRALARALEDARGRAVDLRIVASAPDDVRAVLSEVGRAPLVRLGAFAAVGHASDEGLLEEVRRAAGERGIEAVGGVRSHFTELNRGAAALAPLDAPLAFSITPFMHDRSGHQLVESLGVQRTVVRDAVALADGRRLHIGPVTLGARMNAVSTSPFEPGDADIDHSGYGPQTVPGATDRRQHSPALAAWVVGSLEALAADGVDSLAYFEEWGPRGIVGADGPSPAGRVLEWAAELSGAPRLAVDVPGLSALGAFVGGEAVVLLGNLGGEAVEVAVDGVLEWRRADDGGAAGGAPRLAPGDAVRIVLAGQPSSV